MGASWEERGRKRREIITLPERRGEGKGRKTRDYHRCSS
jgi:hypothetical protein